MGRDGSPVPSTAGLGSLIWSGPEACSRPRLKSKSTLNRPFLLNKSSCPCARLLPRRLVLRCPRTRPSIIRVCQHCVLCPHLSLQFRSALLQINFLQDYGASIVNITNLVAQPYNKDDQYVRAFMSEIVSVFKDITQLDPLFRDQFINFLSTRSRPMALSPTSWQTLLRQSPQVKLVKFRTQDVLESSRRRSPYSR